MRFKITVILLACASCADGAGHATYIGDQFTYKVASIATDANGNTYIAGSRVIVTPTPADNAAGKFDTLTDVFVSRLDPSGKLTLIATWAGKGSDQANGIAVDAAGFIYVAGVTTSSDFPLRSPVQNRPSKSGSTGFLVKLAGDSSVVYSTYIGGTLGRSTANAVAVDAFGNAYVTGETEASDFPNTPGLPNGAVDPDSASGGISGAFFAKVSASGGQILYAGILSSFEHDCGSGSTCFLGTIYTAGVAIAVDPDGNAYVAGNAGGGGLPATTGALLTDGIGAFVAKVNASGNGLSYLTYLGSANYIPGIAPNSNPGNLIYSMAVDAVGNAYVSGSTSDPAFPVTPSAYQTVLAGPPGNPFEGPPSDAFVAKLNPSGTAVVWATFLGGSSSDQARTIAFDPAGNVWVSGATQSADFPRTVAENGTEFLAELNADGSKLLYAATFGANTVSQALVVDAAGMVHAGGSTGSISEFPEDSAPGQAAAPWLFGIANSAGGVLAGRVAPGELISLYGIHLGPASPQTAAFDAAGFLPTTLGGVNVTINGIAAPILYVSDTQINAVAPVELIAASDTETQVTVNGAPTSAFRTMVDEAAPQVFRNSNGSAAALNQDGSVNSPSNPAPVGSFVSIWATGTGYFPGSDGQMAVGANSFCGMLGGCGLVRYAYDAQTGLSDVSPVYGSYTGAAPGMVNGVVQMNFQSLGPGAYFFQVYPLFSDPFFLY